MSVAISREEYQAQRDAEREEKRQRDQAYLDSPLRKAFPALPAEITEGDKLPAAYTLDSEHMNAVRLFGRYGKLLIVIAGRFYYYNGMYWTPDESFVARAAGELPTMLREEAKAARDKYESLAASVPMVKEFEGARRRERKPKLHSTLLAMPTGVEALAALDKAETLERWAKVCESRRAQHNAIELLRGWLNFSPDRLDTDPALLNCWSGTVDLRTGKLQPHDPLDYITKCASVEYERGATAPRFENFLLEIMAGDAGLASFMQRLIGYCATGETREQKAPIFYGDGSNGKSTFLDAVTDALGDYASTAPPGLLTGRGAENRHPTEIMDLMGRRLVRCNEADQGAELREGFLKQLTGETVLKARGMRQDFIEFAVTAKPILSTNHKPVIHGSDYGIWRRILLVPFGVKFGTADEVDTGNVARLVDMTLAEALLDEREGIFEWIVAGAVSWYRFGLEAPASVLAATSEYQSESDRAKQFVSDNCTIDKDAWVTITELYQAYQVWCIEHGYRALGWAKVRDELQRVVPDFRQDSRKQGTRGAGRKTVRGCYGLKLSGSGADAFDTVPVLDGADSAPPAACNLDLV